MRKKLVAFTKKKYKKLALLTQCFLLWLRNLILIRTTPRFDSFELCDKVVIQGNEIEILWKVKGCHKIKIKGFGYFSGNINGVKLIFTNNINPIEITFCGITKKITRKLSVKNSKIELIEKFIIELPEKFIIKTKIPYAVEIPYSRQELKCELIKNNLTVNLENIYFEFEPFNIDNYKPLTQ